MYFKVFGRISGGKDPSESADAFARYCLYYLIFSRINQSDFQGFGMLRLYFRVKCPKISGIQQIVPPGNPANCPKTQKKSGVRTPLYFQINQP